MLNNFFKSRPVTPVLTAKKYQLYNVKGKPVRIIEDIDSITEIDNHNKSECESYSRNAIYSQARSLKDLKSGVPTSQSIKQFDVALKKKSSANPNEGKKYESFDDGSDSNTVIENECDNDYSLICMSLNKSRY
jgi:hypothetical protein